MVKAASFGFGIVSWVVILLQAGIALAQAPQAQCKDRTCSGGAYTRFEQCLSKCPGQPNDEWARSNLKVSSRKCQYMCDIAYKATFMLCPVSTTCRN